MLASEIGNVYDVFQKIKEIDSLLEVMPELKIQYAKTSNVI